MLYRVRGSAIGNMPNNGYQYGRVVGGNLEDSYGPWVDPELQRTPHRHTVLVMERGKRHRKRR